MWAWNAAYKPNDRGYNDDHKALVRRPGLDFVRRGVEPPPPPLYVSLLADQCEPEASTKDQFHLVSPGAGYSREQLKVGDFLFTLKTDDHLAVRDRRALPLVVERKTCSDFKASVKDGRFKSQKAKMIASGFTKVYLIEGNIDEKFNGLDNRHKDLLDEMAIQDGFHVVRAPNKWQTAVCLGQISRLLHQQFDEEMIDADCTMSELKVRASGGGGGGGADSSSGGAPGSSGGGEQQQRWRWEQQSKRRQEEGNGRGADEH